MLFKKSFSSHAIILMLMCGWLGIYQTAVFAAGNAKEAFTRAEALLQEKRYPEAIMLYEKILAQDPSFVPAYPGLVKSYAGLGDLEGGAAFIESLYLEDPNNAGINYGLGYALYQQKDYHTAAGYFVRAIKLDPDLAEAWNNRAVIYHFVERDYQKARKYYEKAVILAEKAGNQKVRGIAQKNLAHLPEKEKIIPVTEPLDLEDFLNRFVALVEEGDTAKLQGLVLGQKDNSIQAMDWLMEQAEKAHGQGDKKSETTAVALGSLLAIQYATCFESNLLSAKLEKYQKTSDIRH
jgi:tetratricopeptide (TPR) repeat protein